MHRALTAMTVAVVFALTSCGDPATAPFAGSSVPTTTPPTTAPPDMAGSCLSVASPGEFNIAFEQQMAGTLELDDNGCWFLGGTYGRGPIVFPPGFTLAEDGTTVIGSDGEQLADGTPMDISGTILYAADELPGGPDGKWGNHLAFCGLHSGLVVASERRSAAKFEIVSGTFTYPDAADLACGGPPKAITVTDVAIAVPDGEATLGTIEITNRSLGCLAG